MITIASELVALTLPQQGLGTRQIICVQFSVRIIIIIILSSFSIEYGVLVMHDYGDHSLVGIQKSAIQLKYGSCQPSHLLKRSVICSA